MWRASVGNINGDTCVRAVVKSTFVEFNTENHVDSEYYSSVEAYQNLKLYF